MSIFGLALINRDGVVKSPIYYALYMNLFTQPSIVEFVTFYEIINREAKTQVMALPWTVDLFP